MITIKQGLKAIAIIIGLSVSLPSLALDLHQAKQQGLVGEQQNGYLGAIKSTPEVNKLVQDINNKRKSAYQKLADQNKVPLATVSKIAGQKAIQKTEPGEYIQSPQGGWVKK